MVHLTCMKTYSTYIQIVRSVKIFIAFLSSFIELTTNQECFLRIFGTALMTVTHFTAYASTEQNLS